MFLLDQRGPLRGRELYSFRPYNWGPFSGQIYADLDWLSLRGFLHEEGVPGRTWKRYSVTEQGRERAGGLIEEMTRDEIEWLGKARRFVTSRSFTRLLSDVYDAYPEFATRSQFRR
jgi:DNA-binding PadR family transcriptional regulator